MMKLSTMKKVVDTVDEEWRSKFAERILDLWGYDNGFAYYYRGSANFIFVFRREGKRYFLRFNESSERDLKTIETELGILQYLHKNQVRVALPVVSKEGRLIETVESPLGIYYAVVFEALEGEHQEFEKLFTEQYVTWGSALGKLHKTFKGMPEDYRKGRHSWKDHLDTVRESLPEKEEAALAELEQIRVWAECLNETPENFGLIHYDFELDNLMIGNSQVSILDFDDCASYWYVADIAYALRDLFEDRIDLENPLFQAFLTGYSSETEVDTELLEQLPMFMRMHNLVTFAKLIRSVDVPESPEHPEWLSGLRSKLVDKINTYRDAFKE